ncbi:ATP-binding protein [uncultured Nocardioides sp.]|uniref:ATP-binding protein n=1 Tax=uncultured Nocardioides sp. TaxID=198441 RepID=UPI0026187E28|nr:ATP-binding protein [uncultured Nocardioides sp.]
MHDERALRPSAPVVPAWTFWCFAAAYVVLVVVGRSTAVADRGPALVWPAAGVGALWLLVRPGAGWATAAMAGIGLSSAVLHLLTGASPGMAAAGTTAALAQPVVAVAALRRWCPSLLGAGGDRTIADPAVLARVVVVVAGSTLAGALAAAAALTVAGETPTAVFVAVWWGRNLAGMLLVATAGHLLLHAVLTGRRVLPPRRRLPELGLVVLAAVAAFGMIDLDGGQPLAFLLIGTSVWCALRFPTVVAAAQVLLTGVLAFGLVALGRGPLDGPPSDLDALTMQAFLVTLLTISLAIGSSRDQRDAVLAELETARREEGRRAQFLETVNDVMAEGMVVLDADARVVRTNSAAREILDLTPAGTRDGVQAADYVVTAPDGRVLDPSEHPSVRAISEGRVGPEDIVLQLEDGTRRTLSVTADRLATEDGAAAGSVVVYRDVTDERRQADQLAEFAATAAHDLRNPLTALRGWIEMAAETDDPVALAGLDRARVAALRMQELITDLLHQASAEGGLLSAADLEAVPLDLAVDDVVQYLTDVAVVTHADELPVVSVHPEMLRQLLTNLLGNAVKYVEPGVRPEVVVSARRVGDRVAVEVRDNGIGIPEDERSLVFERLHRAHATDARYDGTGLGLAICKTVVVRHGGHIECRPAPGGGTVFAFDLPAAVPDVPTVAPQVGGADLEEA